MSLHTVTLFTKAEECLAEAKRLHEGGFSAGACSRAFHAMMFAVKAGLKHGMIERLLHEHMPIDADGAYKAFKEEFVVPRKLHASLLGDFRSVQALKDRADNSTVQVLPIQSEAALQTVSKFIWHVRNVTMPRPHVVSPTPEQVAETLSAPRR